ncbi:MAG TPA: methyltransferase [Flavobacterium sp.]|nr:methyltransferase [Flavobacterium sp.]
MKALIKRIISPVLQKVSAFYLKKRRKYTYKNISVWVEPTVFPPFITISTKLLLQFIETLALKDKKFLELGCGCGIISILAAQKGAAVTATDINVIALEALEKNASSNTVSIEIVHSDLFENLAEKSFDVMVINPPYYPKTPHSVAENAWFCGENFEYFEALFAQLPKFTTSENEIYMILSENCELQKIKAIALKNEMAFELVLEKKVASETNYIFRIRNL